MRHDDGGTTVSKNLLQGGEGTADTGVVSDLTILIEGYVEVYTYDCLLTGKVVLKLTAKLVKIVEQYTLRMEHL